MFKVPTKVEKRIKESLKKFQPIIEASANSDANETDTVTIVKDIFSECFGFDKYSELTSEYAIRNTYCDLAVKIDDEVKILIEIKAPGIGLKENQIKQAVDYAANSGVEWVVLTNCVEWKLYKIEFKQPIDIKLIMDFDITKLNPKNKSTAECLYVFTKEGIKNGSLKKYYGNAKATDRFLISSVILNEKTLNLIRREIKKIHSSAKIDNNVIADTILSEIIKRDISESEELKQAIKKTNKIQAKELKSKQSRKTNKVKEEKVDQLKVS